MPEVSSIVYLLKELSSSLGAGDNEAGRDALPRVP